MVELIMLILHGRHSDKASNKSFFDPKKYYCPFLLKSHVWDPSRLENLTALD